MKILEWKSKKLLSSVPDLNRRLCVLNEFVYLNRNNIKSIHDKSMHLVESSSRSVFIVVRNHALFQQNIESATVSVLYIKHYLLYIKHTSYQLLLIV